MRETFDQHIKDDTKKHENIRKNSTGQEDAYTTGCLLDYSYSKDNINVIAINISKQEAFDAVPKAKQ